MRVRETYAPLQSSGRTLVTAVYYLSYIALGMTAATFGPTLPYLADQTNSALSAISYLFTTRSLGYLFGSLQGGRLYDRVRGHPLMAAALMVIIGAMALAPITRSLGLLVLVFLALGVGESTLDVGGNTLLVWLHRERVGPFMNGLHFFFAFGAFLAPIIVAQVVQASDGYSWAYWILALFAVPLAAWLLCLPSPKAPADAGKGSLRQTGRSATAGGNGILVALLAGFLLLNVGAEVGFAGWLFSYAVASGLASEASAAYLTAAFWGALTLGRLLAIPMSTRARPSVMLRADLAGCLVSLAIIILFADSPLALWVGAMGTGLSMASIVPVTMSLGERRMAITGQIMGWFFVGASLGAMSLPWFMGQLFDSINPLAAMVATFVAVLAAAGVLGALLLYSGRRPAGRAEPQILED